MTGRYPHSTGAAELHQPLPADQVIFPALLKAAGYYTASAGKWHLGPSAKKGFDVVLEGGGESGADKWLSTLRERPKDKPFFLWLAAIDAHRDYKPGAFDPPHRPEDVTVPPFLPDAPETRADLANYYDEIARLDKNLGLVLDELAAQKVADNTIVIFLADNGRPFPRCKTTLYDSGIRTPLIIRWPGAGVGGITGELVSTVDLAPTILDLAGITPPKSTQGYTFRKLLSPKPTPWRREIFAEHNWHDYQAHERAIRTARWLYIRNSFPQLTGSPPADAVRSPTFELMLRLHDAGKLPPDQAGPLIAPRAAEELYDCDSDPHQLKNLAADPQHASTLAELRARLNAWIKETGDRVPEKPTPDKYDRRTGKLPTAN
jgi:arylsulfatase A-like enzyme